MDHQKGTGIRGALWTMQSYFRLKVLTPLIHSHHTRLSTKILLYPHLSPWIPTRDPASVHSKRFTSGTSKGTLICNPMDISVKPQKLTSAVRGQRSEACPVNRQCSVATASRGVPKVLQASQVVWKQKQEVASALERVI